MTSLKRARVMIRLSRQMGTRMIVLLQSRGRTSKGTPPIAAKSSRLVSDGNADLLSASRLFLLMTSISRLDLLKESSSKFLPTSRKDISEREKSAVRLETSKGLVRYCGEG